MIFNLGELFSGPGGLALGAGMADEIVSSNGKLFSIKHVWGVDKDKDAIDTYRENIVKKYGGIGLKNDAVYFCEKKIDQYPPIDALAFGFPCNDFSLVGEKNGFQGKYGNLYKAGLRALKKMNPYWFIAENVSGIHSVNSGKAFKKILSELKNAGNFGYELTVHLYKFERYGVPQYRHRYIIVGIRKDQNLEFKVPAPAYDEDEKMFITAGEALTDIPDGIPNSELPRHDSRIAIRLKYTPPWHNAWFLDELLELPPKIRRKALEEKLPWYKDEIENLSDYKIRKQIESSKLNCKKARMSHIYKRLDKNRPAYTVTGSGGGGTHVYHWEECRALTNRERARLQGFPDWFKFMGTKDQVRKQIGMAVPPEGSKIIFESILKTFAGINYRSIRSNYSFEKEI